MDIGSNPRDAIWRTDAQYFDEKLQADLAMMRPGGVAYEDYSKKYSLIDKYGNIVAAAGEY